MSKTQFTSSQLQVAYLLSGFLAGNFDSPAGFLSISPVCFKTIFKPYSNGGYSGIEMNLKDNLTSQNMTTKAILKNNILW